MIIFPAFVIHLDSVEERLPIISNLEKDLKIPITIFSASDGSELWGTRELRHPWRFDKLTKGMVGCGISHYNLLKKVLNENMEGVFLLEDDAKVNSSIEEINGLIEEINKFPWDIILLGANEYVESEVQTMNIQKVRRFWGAHSMLIKKECIPFILQTFEDFLEKDVCLYGDWLYKEAISKYNLKVYGPSLSFINKHFSQSEGFVSALTGKRR